jgi:hypothetical protein
MKTKKTKTTINTIHVVSKHDKVFVKSNTETNAWRLINFQWIPVFST